MREVGEVKREGKKMEEERTRRVNNVHRKVYVESVCNHTTKTPSIYIVSINKHHC